MSCYSTILKIYIYVEIHKCFVLFCLLKFHNRFVVTVHMTKHFLGILRKPSKGHFANVIKDCGEKNDVGALVVMVSNLKASISKSLDHGT